MSNHVEVWKKAVLEKSSVAYYYKDSIRLACPHMLGKCVDGRTVVHAYQYAGGSSKGTISSPELGGWRFFFLEDCSLPIATESQVWYPPANLQKKEYTPPKFVLEVLALAPQT